MSDTLEIKGSVKLIEDTQTFGSGFQKREFVITTPGDYPQDIKFEVLKDKCEKLDQVTVGSEVLVSFNVKGNEYNGKHYVNLQCWKFEVLQAAQQQAQSRDQPHYSAPTPAANLDDTEEIPF